MERGLEIQYFSDSELIHFKLLLSRDTPSRMESKKKENNRINSKVTMFNTSFCLIETHRVVIVKFRTRAYTGLPIKNKMESSETTVHNKFSRFCHNYGFLQLETCCH